MSSFSSFSSFSASFSGFNDSKKVTERWREEGRGRGELMRQARLFKDQGGDERGGGGKDVWQKLCFQESFLNHSGWGGRLKGLDVVGRHFIMLCHNYSV